jgi:hypothetical protein
MRCYKIRDVEELRSGAAARDLLRDWNQIMRRKRESRCMEHLADVASRLGSLGVMVHKSEAGHDVEQHQAAKNCQRLARELFREEPGW